MGRKCKLTPEVQDKFFEFIRDGFNISDTCYAMGISVSTFNRWRNRYPDFDKAINEATSRQWEDSIAFAHYGRRKYTRKFFCPSKYPSTPQKPLCEPLCASQSLFTEQSKRPQEQMVYNLPVRDMYSTGLEIGKRYYDPKLGRVFYRDKNHCLCSMTLDRYLRQKRDNETPFLGVIV